MSDYYRLEGTKTIPCRDVLEWAVWFEGRNRHVAKDIAHGCTVSTIFLGLDHSYGMGGPPLLFETMVFPPGSWSELWSERYSTWEEARHGHKRAIQWVYHNVTLRQRLWHWLLWRSGYRAARWKYNRWQMRRWARDYARYGNAIFSRPSSSQQAKAILRKALAAFR